MDSGYLLKIMTYSKIILNPHRFQKQNITQFPQKIFTVKELCCPIIGKIHYRITPT